jgi:uncharacterized membrane protein
MRATEPHPENMGKPLEEGSRRHLAKARREGAVGSILLILSNIPYLGAILGAIGFILILMAGKHISENLGNRSIFKHMCVAAILGILGAITGAGWLYPSLIAYMLTSTCLGGDASLNIILPVLLPALIITWILTTASAVFLRKSLNAVASGLGLRKFKTAALLYFIGAILILFTTLSFFVAFIAKIALAIAFTLMPRQMSGALPPPSQQSQTN